MLNKRVVLLAPIALVVLVVCVYAYSPRVRAEAHLQLCHFVSEEHQVECIFKILESEMGRGGMFTAMPVFSSAYKSFYSFASTGCHKYAHRMGDIAYFKEYLAKKDMRAMNFPQETTACGYGFYHGFLEHLIQDNPSPRFVTETCTYLTERLGGTMGSIRLICYHGSGHGFVLAHVETLPSSAWGNAWTFVGEPLKECDSLPGATREEKEQCRQGVFNMLVEWMQLEQYEFSYDTEDPFSTCRTMPERYWHDCYYETSQKLDRLSGRDPVRIAEIVQHAPTEKIRRSSFEVGVAGIIQQTIADERGYEETLARCALLDDPLFMSCMKSILRGLFEHGAPQEEYKKVLVFCEDAYIAARGQTKACFWFTAESFIRFYTPEKALELCTTFPEAYRDICALRIEKGSSQ